MKKFFVPVLVLILCLVVPFACSGCCNQGENQDILHSYSSSSLHDSFTPTRDFSYDSTQIFINSGLMSGSSRASSFYIPSVNFYVNHYSVYVNQNVISSFYNLTSLYSISSISRTGGVALTDVYWEIPKSSMSDKRLFTDISVSFSSHPTVSYVFYIEGLTSSSIIGYSNQFVYSLVTSYQHIESQLNIPDGYYFTYEYFLYSSSNISHLITFAFPISSSFYSSLTSTDLQPKTVYSQTAIDFLGSESSPQNSYYFNSGYQQGFLQGKDEGILEGTDKGYNKGYGQGYNKGYFDAGQAGADFSFFGLMSSMFDTLLSAFTNLFSFEIFGYDIKSFLLALLSLSIVFIFLKFSSGGQ